MSYISLPFKFFGNQFATMLFPPVIHNFRYKARVEHGNE